MSLLLLLAFECLRLMICLLIKWFGLELQAFEHRDEKPCNVSLIDSLVLLLLFVHLFSFVEARRKKNYCISVLDQWIQTLG